MLSCLVFIVYQELRITQILSPSNPHGNPAARGPASNNSIMEADDTAHLFRHGTHASFIEAIRVGVCRGPYSPRLLTEWDAYADANESENDRPGKLEWKEGFADGCEIRFL